MLYISNWQNVGPNEVIGLVILLILIKIIQQRMQKEYKKIYFDLTRYNLLPNNCMPLSKGKSKHQLNKLREINKSILDIIDPQTSAYFHNKRHSQANVVKVQKEIQTNRSPTKRIHDNAGQIRSTKYLTLEGIQSNELIKSSKKKFQLQNAFQSANNTIVQKRKDLYDVHIQNYMNTKYNSEEVIDNYLNNRQQFIKKACQEIENEIKQHSGSKKKSVSKIKLKQYQSKLPKIQEFSNRMLEKSTHRSRDGSFQKQLTHIQKASQLQIKNRKRNQRVFRKKIHSLQMRLDKIRFLDDV